MRVRIVGSVFGRVFNKSGKVVAMVAIDQKIVCSISDGDTSVHIDSAVPQ